MSCLQLREVDVTFEYSTFMLDRDEDPAEKLSALGVNGWELSITTTTTEVDHDERGYVCQTTHYIRYVLKRSKP